MNIKDKIHSERVEFVCEPGLYTAFKAQVKERTGSNRNVAKTLRWLMAAYLEKELNVELEEFKKDVTGRLERLEKAIIKEGR